MRRRLLALTGLAAVATLGAAPAGTLAGRVVAVADGDTLTLLTPARTELKVRLNGIDAPEKGQPWGDASKHALSRLAYDRTVTVRSTGRDRYGRTLGEVRVGTADVGSVMVRGGAAWAYRRYLTDDRLIRLEAEARAARRGLWALPPEQTTAPWAWRAEQRAEVGPATAGSGQALQCGARRHCSEMRTCAEARFHLKQCGLKKLDADDDGVPCEALCSVNGASA